MHTFTPFRSKLMLTLAALVLIAAAVAVPLAFSSGYSHAAPAQHNASNRGKLDGTPFRATRKTRSVRAHVHPGRAELSTASVSGDPSFLYVDDGSSFDLIDVFQVSTIPISFVGAFPTGGSFSSGFFGTQDIAVTPANSTHGPCLVYIDNSNGFVSSFPINANGTLGGRVSHLFNFNPIDVHISLDGTLVYVNSLSFSNTSRLTPYSLGAGCALTALPSLSTTHFYVSFVLPALTRLVTVDSNTGHIDTYALTPSGGISLLNSVPGQIFQPDSVAVPTGVSDVFTGQATNNSPRAQGGLENPTTGAINFLSGSPVRDPDPFNSDGAAVFVDNSDSLLVQGEQGSASLVLYSFTASSMALKQNNVFLDFRFAEPTTFAQRGNVLFVNGGVGGDLEACLISSSGIAFPPGCQTVAVLSNTTGFAGGSVILSI